MATSSEPRCTTARSFLLTAEDGETVEVFLFCRKVEDHPGRFHKTKSPVSGKDLRWEDGFTHSHRLLHG